MASNLFLILQYKCRGCATIFEVDEHGRYWGVRDVLDAFVNGWMELSARLEYSLPKPMCFALHVCEQPFIPADHHEGVELSTHQNPFESCTDPQCIEVAQEMRFGIGDVCGYRVGRR